MLFCLSSPQVRMGKSLLLLFLFLCCCAPSFGQRPIKKDFVVEGDTALRQGFVRDIPSENNTAIYFARSKKDGYSKLTTAEVSEFQISERLFFRKDIAPEGRPQTVFLEKLAQSDSGVVFWKLNGEEPLYFVESSQSIELLDESFRQQLADALGNPMLDPLLDLTRRDSYSLGYLARVANTIEKPRTFSRIFVVTPFVGYSSQTVGLVIPDSNQEGRITASSPAFGLNGEAFLTFRRNLSFNVGVSWTQFDSQEYFVYEYGTNRYESDVFVDFDLLQIPVTMRYYFDLEPNRWRLYAEAGYSHAIPSYEKLGVYQGKIALEEVVTSVRDFGMGDRFSGFTWGIGVERYLSKHQGVVFGLRQFKVTGKNDGFVQGLTFHMGYKF